MITLFRKSYVSLHPHYDCSMSNDFDAGWHVQLDERDASPVASLGKTYGASPAVSLAESYDASSL